MSERFPSEAYRELCIENADRLREEWEPKPGDWAVRIGDKDKKPLILAYVHKHYFYTVNKRGQRIRIGTKELYAPLSQPGQLIGILEKRGYRGSMWFDIASELSSGEAGPYSVQIFHKDRAVHYPLREGEVIFQILTVGPDPATALLRAWLEVVGK